MSGPCCMVTAQRVQGRATFAVPKSHVPPRIRGCSGPRCGPKPRRQEFQKSLTAPATQAGALNLPPVLVNLGFP